MVPLDSEPSPFDRVAEGIGDLPVWVWHGEEDPVVPVEESRFMAEALEEAGADVRYTELRGIGHNAWDPTYGSTAFTDWLFAQRR